jgi:hypothetical protein
MPTKDEIKEFSFMIEKFASEKNLTVMDAICHYCKENQLEVEMAATLISPPLKAKIKAEAEDLNLLKKTARLPI